MKILLAIDGSAYTGAAVDFLRRFPFPQEREATLLTVVEPLVPSDVADLAAVHHEGRELAGLQAEAQTESQALVDRHAETLRSHGWQVDTATPQGPVAEQILKEAEQRKVDLIVIGARGLGGVRRYLLGSVSDKVLKMAPCSVLIVRTPPHGIAETRPRAGDSETGAPLRILLAYDDSLPSREAADLLASLPLDKGAEVAVISVLTVATTFYRQDIRERLSESWRRYVEASTKALERVAETLRRVTPQVTVRLLDGGTDASDEILEAADLLASDVIMLGATGRGELTRFLLGSVTSRVVHHAPCGVWVVKPPAGAETG